jgi:hypothetical protein
VSHDLPFSPATNPLKPPSFFSFGVPAPPLPLTLLGAVPGAGKPILRSFVALFWLAVPAPSEPGEVVTRVSGAPPAWWIVEDVSAVADGVSGIGRSRLLSSSLSMPSGPEPEPSSSVAESPGSAHGAVGGAPRTGGLRTLRGESGMVISRSLSGGVDRGERAIGDGSWLRTGVAHVSTIRGVLAVAGNTGMIAGTRGGTAVVAVFGSSVKSSESSSSPCNAESNRASSDRRVRSSGDGRC